MEAAAASGNDGFVYIDAGNSELRSATLGGEDIGYGVTDAEVIGARADIDGDGQREVPYVDSNNNLKIINDQGNQETLFTSADISDSPDLTKSQLIIGNWDEDQFNDGDTKYDVFLAANDDIYRVDYDEQGSPEKLGITTKQVDLLIASIDITGDGARELVYIDSNSALRYVNNTGDDSELSTNGQWGANNQIGFGSPDNLDGSGGSSPSGYEFPIIDGSDNVDLLPNKDPYDENNNFTGTGKPTVPATGDLSGDGTPDHIYISKDNNKVKYEPHPSLTDSGGTYTTSSGQNVKADSAEGLASRISSFEDRESISDSGSTASDTTAPSFATGYPSTGNPTQDGFDINVKADEDGTAYHVVLSDGATEPTISDVKNGQDGDGNAAADAANAAITASTEKTFTASGLNSDTAYDVYVVVEDGAGNAQKSARLDQSTDTDSTAPSSLTVDGPTSETVIQSSDSLTVDYSYTEDNPNTATIKLVDGSGNTATFNIDDSAYAGDDTTKSESLNLGNPDSTGGSGLVDGTTYDIEMTATDANGQSSTTTQAGVVTIDDTAPSISDVALVDDTDGDGTVTSGDTVELTATVTDSNAVNSVDADAAAFDAGTVSLADSGPNSTSSDDQYSATATVGSSVTDGDQSISVDATDEAANGGGQNAGSGTLTVDTTAPSSVSVDSPTSETIRRSDGTLDVTYSYTDDTPASTTLTLTDGTNTAEFTVSDSSYAGDNTERTVTLDLASPDTTGGNGLVDGTTYDIDAQATDEAGQSASTTGADLVTVDDTAPSVTADSVSFSEASDGTLEFGFTTDEQLDGAAGGISVSVDGPSTTDAYTFDRAAFDETDNGDGTYTYNLSTSQTFDDGDGTYTGAVDTAADVAGNDGATGESDTVSISSDSGGSEDFSPPSVSAFDVQQTGNGDIVVSFESDEALGAIEAAVSGAESAAMTDGAFTESVDGSTYTYEATYSADTAGDYTVELTRAEDAAGNDGADGQTGSATVSGPTVPADRFELSRSTDGLTVSFVADQSLGAIDVAVDGPTTAQLNESAFTERETASGNYSYRTSVPVDGRGTYEATLETAAAAGLDGASGQTTSVTVEEESLTVDPRASSYLLGVGSEVTLAAGGTAPTGTETTYEWDTDDDGTADVTGAEVTTAFDEPGEYPITVVATAGEERVSETVTVTVEDGTAPNAAFTRSETSVSEGTTVTFDAGESTDAVGVDSYEWDFDGDGTTDATGPTVSRAMDNPGTHEVTLTVTDAAGNTDTATETIAVSGPELRQSDTALVYGAVATGSQATDSVTLTNDGTTPLAVSDVETTGADATAFRAGSIEAPLVVNPGTTVTVPVTFAPTTAGERSSTLELTTNDTDAGQATVALDGNAAASPLSVVGEPSVGEVAVGDTGTAALQVRNDGDSAVTVTDAAVARGATSQFTLTDESALSDPISPGETRTVTVTFTPRATGTQSAALELATDSEAPLVAGVTGTGTGAAASFAADTVRFGEVSPNATATRTVRVVNDGTDALAVDSVTAGGPNAAAFTVTDAPAVVPAGSAGVVTVAYAPAAPGSAQATLTLAGNQSAGQAATTDVRGSTAAASIGLDRRSLNFGNVTRGETVRLNLTVKNLASSETDLRVGKTPVVGENPGAFSVVDGGAPFALAPGEQHTVEVAFTPRSAGTKDAQLQLISDASDPQVSVWLTNERTYIVVQPVADESPDTATVNVDAKNVDTGDGFDINVSQPETRQRPVGFEAVGMTVDQTDTFEINLTHAESPPSEDAVTYRPADGRQTLQYVELDHTVDPTVTYGDTSVTYRVDKSALPEGTDPEAVRLHRWNGSAWNFTTSGELVDESDSEYVYRVDTPGFSQFAVSAPTADAAGDTSGEQSVSDAGVEGGGVSLVSTTLHDTSLTVDETTTATARLRNNGSTAEAVTVALAVNGRTVETTTVTVPAQGKTSVTFTRSFAAAGDYTISVQGTAAGTVTVESDDSSLFGLALPFTWLGLVLLLIPIVAVLLLLLLWRRSDDEEDEPEEPVGPGGPTADGPGGTAATPASGGASSGTTDTDGDD